MAKRFLLCLLALVMTMCLSRGMTTYADARGRMDDSGQEH